MRTTTIGTWVPEWSFGDRVRKVRTEMGLDQREFAVKLELKAPTLSSYEAGRANPRSRDLPKLAARLELLTGVPRTWFLGWDNEKGPASEETGPVVRPLGLEPRTHWLRDHGVAPFKPVARHDRSTGPKRRAA